MFAHRFGDAFTTRQAGRLTARIYYSRKEMGAAAASDVADRLRILLEGQREVVMVFAAAPSQDDFLDALRSQPDIDWGRVVAMHMDEYVGLPPGAPQRFSAYLHEHIWNSVRPGMVHCLSGDATDPGAECRRYGDLLREHPADILCAGIGENGHLAFNDPSMADFEDPEQVKLVGLDSICRQQQVNDGCFHELADVPCLAMTLTIPALMSARWVYCMVPGPAKAEAVRRSLNDPVSRAVPATILRIHPRAALYLDLSSAAGLI